MKKLSTIILTLSLFAGSSVFAQNNFAGFYPVEDNDTPDYILSLDAGDDKVHQKTNNQVTKENVFSSFYPVEDNDSSEYFLSLDSSDGTYQTTTNRITNENTFDAFYPAEDID